MFLSDCLSVSVCLFDCLSDCSCLTVPLSPSVCHCWSLRLPLRLIKRTQLKLLGVIPAEQNSVCGKFLLETLYFLFLMLGNEAMIRERPQDGEKVIQKFARGSLNVLQVKVMVDVITLFTSLWFLKLFIIATGMI